MSSILLKGAQVLTMDRAVGDLVGDVLIEGDTIAAVAPVIEGRFDRTIDCTDSIVMPGFVDAHIHLWQSALRGLASSCWGREYFGLVHPLSGRLRPEDMYEATRAGALELLTHGVTTALDFCHATNSAGHAAASVAGLSDAGIRAVFAFSFRPRPEATTDDLPDFAARAKALAELVASEAKNATVRMGASLNNIEHVSEREHAAEIRAARALGIPSTVHANLPGQVAQSASLSLLGSDVLWVHCGPITDAELDALAEAQSPLIVTPEVEAAQMGITPNLGRAVRHGVPVALGTDTPTGVNGDPFVQMRMAMAIDHHSDSWTDRVQGRPPSRRPDSPALDADRVLRMATIDGARALGLDEVTGSISAGKAADLLIIDTAPFGVGAASPAEHVVLQAGSGKISRVFVAGNERFVRGTLVGVDVEALRSGLDRSRDYVLGRGSESQWAEMTPELRARYEAGQGRAD